MWAIAPGKGLRDVPFYGLKSLGEIPMSDFAKINRWIDRVEASLAQRTAGSRPGAGTPSARVANKIARVAQTASRSGDVREKLRAMSRLAKVAESLSAPEIAGKSLAEVERAVDRIYGDQSKNETYYFSRRNRSAVATSRRAYHVPSLAEAEEEADRTYGDQSKNETFYPGRRSARSLRAQEEALMGWEDGMDSGEDALFEEMRSASWADFAAMGDEEDLDAAWAEPEMAFEDDGEWVDEEDMY